MKTANELTPFIATHPGEIIYDELKARGISQVDFAILIGMAQSRSQLNEIIKGKRNINADLALLLEKALGIDADFWMETQKNYDLDTARIEAKNQARLEAIEKWNLIEPVVGTKFLKRQQIISGDPLSDLPIIYKVFNVQSMEQLATLKAQPAFTRFRKSQKLQHDPINIITWVKLVQFKAKSIEVPSFRIENKEELLAALRQILTENTNTLARISEKLKEYGIKLIYQEKGEKSPIDGVSFWSERNPAIGMTLRHSRLDNFAFTLFHELGHIFKHLVNDPKTEFIDLISTQESEEYKRTKEELEANEFAANALINPMVWKEFFSKYISFPDQVIINFAEQINIHPCIVRGRLTHEFNFYRAKTDIDYQIY